MRKKFKPGDILEFGYGEYFPKGKYEVYRTILLLEDTGNFLWRGVLINDTNGYYDDLDHFIVDDETKLVWRDKRKKALDGKAATC
jgi:hypothetical protein